jgi:glucose/arabinose dehydrogenase
MKKITQTITHSLIGIIGVGAAFMLAPGASAQNVFVSDYQTGDIYEYNSAGQSSVFATGFENLSGIAFNSAGDLFVTDEGRGNTMSSLTIKAS